MKNYILGFAFGLAAGCLGTYIYMKDYCDRVVAEETEEVRKYYDLKKLERTEDPEYVTENEDEPEQAKDEPDYNEIIEKLNYNQYSTKPSEPVNKVTEEPYIISNSQFTDNNGFNKVMLSYFDEDEVLMDVESEKVIDEVDSVVGYSNLDQFGITDDEDELYIRNEIYGVDYHIIKENGSYQDFIGEY